MVGWMDGSDGQRRAILSLVVFFSSTPCLIDGFLPRLSSLVGSGVLQLVVCAWEEAAAIHDAWVWRTKPGPLDFLSFCDFSPGETHLVPITGRRWSKLFLCGPIKRRASLGQHLRPATHHPQDTLHATCSMSTRRPWAIWLPVSNSGWSRAVPERGLTGRGGG